MFHYVYKITNLINGKIYIGKRSSRVEPLVDKYMGSGKYILNAIKKYGSSSFKKEILGVYPSKEEAARVEQSLVTPEFILREDVYNLHCGGFGGFEHINNNPEKRKEVNEICRKLFSGGRNGGTKWWTEESWKKVRETAWSKDNPPSKNVWQQLSKEKKESIAKRASERQGSINRNFGWFISPEGIKKRIHKEKVPDGWISVHEFNEVKMKNSRRWFNNGERNFFLYLSDPVIMEMELIKGRITA